MRGEILRSGRSVAVSRALAIRSFRRFERGT